MASRDFLHLRGFQVSTDPAGESIELLIRGFRNQREIEAFVLRLRALGLVNLVPRPAVVIEEPEETEGNA